MKIIILGATGQLGSNIYQYLKQKFPDRKITGTTTNKNNTQLLIFDPFSENWQKLGQVDVLINCIGIIEEKGESNFTKIHLKLANLIKQNYEKIGKPLLIHLSALGASPEHPSRFLSTKGIADEVLKNLKSVYIIRPSIVCTPNTMLVQKIRLLKRISRYTIGIIPLPEIISQTKIQPVLITDLLEIIANLINKRNYPEKILEVVGKERFTISQLILLMKGVQIIKLPTFIFKSFSIALATLFPWIINKEQLILLEQNNIGNPAAAESILGRSVSSTLPFWLTELKK